MLIAQGRASPCQLLGRMANRHGLIAGATGTGKTFTLRVLAERFSQIGVPVFMADIKGDLAGITRPGSDNGKISERIKQLRIKNCQFAGFPTVFRTSLANTAIPSEPRFPKWDHCCSDGY